VAGQGPEGEGSRNRGSRLAVSVLRATYEVLGPVFLISLGLLLAITGAEVYERGQFMYYMMAAVGALQIILGVRVIAKLEIQDQRR